MKRAYKLQEFVAHTSHVNCLKIGRKSAGVLVTGGEDKKVNVWAIGKPTPVLVSFGYFVRTWSTEMSTGLLTNSKVVFCRACRDIRVQWSVSPLIAQKRLW